MAITAEAVKTALNAHLTRTETTASLATDLQDAIEDIANRDKWPDLHTSADTAIVADDRYIDDPTDIRVLDKVIVNDGTSDSEPLEEMTWDDYLKAVADGGASTGEPDRYCRHGGRLYLYPTAAASPRGSAYSATVTYSTGDRVTYGGSSWTSLQDANTGNTPAEGAWWTATTAGTVTVWYWKHHGDPAVNIEFGDQFRQAVIYGTEMYHLLNLGLEAHPKFAQVQRRFEAAVAGLRSEADSQPHFVQYHGL